MTEARSSAYVHDRVQEISQLVERAAPDGQPLDLLEPDVRKKLVPVLQRAPEAVVRMALLSDCLVVAALCLGADGRSREAELAWVAPLARDAAPYFAKVREAYAAMELEKDAAGELLEAHASDPMVFGGACKATAWLGLDLCHRAATRSGDPEPLLRYEGLIGKMLADLYELGGLTPEDVRARDRLAELLLRSSSLLAAAPAAAGPDPRLLAFCSREAPEVFHAVASASQIYEPDPFDVERIHAEARDVFARALERVVDPGRTDPGRILLLLGESGSGKTHLMRAFRNTVHQRRLGMVGYLQMTVGAEDYARYVVGRLVDSLQQPHARPEVEQSSLTCLSDALAELLEPFDRASLCEDDLGDSGLGVFVQQQADYLLSRPGFEAVHPDVIRALLYLQRRDPPITSRVVKFLRCEPLSPYEQQRLGSLAPWSAAPERMLTAIAHLLSVTGQGALVLLVDQLEDLQNQEGSTARFLRALDVMRHLVEECPSTLVVLACLEEFYHVHRTALPGPVRDRVERDPEVHRLATHRDADEVEALIARRLEVLYESMHVRFREDEPLFPFTREELAELSQERTRDVLDRCRLHQARSAAAGALADWSHEPSGPAVASPALDAQWNDHLASFGASVPDDDGALAALLARSIADLEAEGGARLEAASDGRFVVVRGGAEPLLIGICNASPRGGGLGKQIDELRARAAKMGAKPIAARSTDYPDSPKTKVAGQLAQLVQAGGRRVVIQDSDWRVMQALGAFVTTHGGAPGLGAARRAERPLMTLASLVALLGAEPFEVPAAKPLDKPRPAGDERASPSVAPPPSPSAQLELSVPASAGASGAITVGMTRGLAPKPVLVSPKDLTTHAAFLGTTGSGKTTLALCVIEELLRRGTPAILVDRKGDLAIYGASEHWEAPLADAELARRRAALRERVHVDVFTPGNPAGRALRIPLVPPGLAELAPHERAQIAGWAASALGAMMGLRPASLGDEPLRVMLQRAIEVLSRLRPSAPPALGDLIEVLDRQDPDVVAAIGKLDPKRFAKLVEHLETLRLGRGHLLGEPSDEELEPGRMLSPAPGGRARLTVISTKFLGDNASIEFWMARFLASLSRWSSRHPSAELRGVLLLDEADLYMPATRKPATKEPLSDLLRRARSAGLGVLLATQSPGDLDYKGRDNIRTWWIGRVTADTAVEKMKPLLSEARVQIGPKLAGLDTGEFFQVSSGHVIEMRAHRSLLRTEQLPEDRIETVARATRSQQQPPQRA